jgi:hypothetical protein
MAKAGCYKMKKSLSINKHCLWVRTNKRHLCSPPVTCLEKALKKSGCYVYKKSKAVAKKCAWI